MRYTNAIVEVFDFLSETMSRLDTVQKADKHSWYSQIIQL